MCVCVCVFGSVRGSRTPYWGSEPSPSWMLASSRKGKSSGEGGPAGPSHRDGHRVRNANRTSRLEKPGSGWGQAVPHYGSVYSSMLTSRHAAKMLRKKSGVWNLTAMLARSNISMSNCSCRHNVHECRISIAKFLFYPMFYCDCSSGLLLPSLTGLLCQKQTQSPETPKVFHVNIVENRDFKYSFKTS